MNESHLLRAFTICTILATAAAGALADDLVWIGGSGDWDDDASWSTGTEPTIGDAVEISDGDTVEVTQTGEVCAELTLATLDPATLNVGSGGGLEVSGLARVGAGGLAILSQIGGSVSLGRLEIGGGGSVLSSGGSLAMGTCKVGGFALPSTWNIGGPTTISDALEIDTNGVVSVSGSLVVEGTPGAGGAIVVSRGWISLEGSQGTVQFPDFSAETTSLIRAKVTATGLNPIEVVGTASLDGFLRAYDLGAAEGRYDVLVAQAISGTFTDVTLPGENWSWGIEEGTVYVMKGVTPVEEATWGELKSTFR